MQTTDALWSTRRGVVIHASWRFESPALCFAPMLYASVPRSFAVQVYRCTLQVGWAG